MNDSKIIRGTNFFFDMTSEITPDKLLKGSIDNEAYKGNINSILEKISLSATPIYFRKERYTTLTGQDSMIDRFNKERLVLPSAADYYQFFKQIIKNRDDEYYRVMLDELKKDFDIGIVTSTRIIGRGDENSMINHNCRNKWIYKPKKEAYIPRMDKLQITDAFDFGIEELVNDGSVDITDHLDGLRFIRTLFGTDDDKETIVNVLEYVTRKPRFKIRVNTSPNLNQNDRTNEKAVYFLIDHNYEFIIDCTKPISNEAKGVARSLTYRWKR